MKASELRERLLSEGCNESSLSILSRGHDAYCLYHRNDIWIVCYSERGQDSEPIFSSPSEENACEFFFDYVTSMEHRHLVGFFEHKSEAEVLQKELDKFEISWI